MKELSIKEKAERYDELLIKLQKAKVDNNVCDERYCCVIDDIVPELKESEDERIRQRIIHALHGDVLEMSEIKEAIAWLERQKEFVSADFDDVWETADCNELTAPLEKYSKDAIKEMCHAWYDKGIELERRNWLEKQGEKKPCMIQWKGDNLKEVIDFTGKDKNFEKWFKSFEEYEKYVGDHNGIFKLFNEDGSHYEVPVGAWMVKTPDGYNIASKAVLKQKSAVEWSEEDQAHLESIDESLFMFESGRHENVVEGTEDDRNWLKSLKSRVQPKQEWSEEDEDNFKHLMDEIVCLGNSRNSANRLHYDKLIKFLYELKNLAQPREEWRDKDERMLDRLIAYFEKRVAFTDDDNPRYANWLKSLKYRVQPQPKKEWSEEDEKILQWIVNDIKRLIDDNKKADIIANQEIKWLKSLSHNGSQDD